MLDESTLRELETASIHLARGAGAILGRYQPGSIEIDYKGHGLADPVTEADLRVEEYLRDTISREFPDHGVIGEESEASGRDTSDFTWVIDPLDGTANFISGMPLYAISIGLLYKGVPLVGSLFLPHTLAGEGVYHARVGGGAYAGTDLLKPLPTQLRRLSGLAGLPASYLRMVSFKRHRGRSSDKRGLGEIRVMGSIACEMVMVASGVLQYSLFMGSRIWDVAAGVVLIREAGGEVLEWLEGEWRPFTDFVVTSQQGGTVGAQALRRWGAPLLVGGLGIVTELASRIRPKRPIIRSLLNWIRFS